MSRARALFRWDPRVRRGAVLAKATLSPAGVLTGGALAALGLATGIGLPWVIGAGLAAWGTSIVLHLRDPKLVATLVEPEFERDLSVLDGEHLSYMTAALSARDRFEAAALGMPDGDDFGGMRARVTNALERLYDSVVWAQRAAGFLRSVNPQHLYQRLQAAPAGSPLAEEISEQIEEITNVQRRRDETLARVATTVTGIETLAVKMGSLALGTASGSIEATAAVEVRQLRRELDDYVDGLTEVEQDLRQALPDIAE